jgi:protein gp37
MSTPTTGIEWTDACWNPVRGCSRVSEGCRHCYAEGIAARFSGPGLAYEGLAKMTKGGPRWTGKVQLVPEALDQPLRWKKPRRIFVNSMSDLVHEALADDEIASIFAVAVAAHHLRGHTFQILTKRAERMAHTLASEDFWLQVNAEAEQYVLDGTDPDDRRSDDARATLDDYGPHNPPPGLWGGVSVESQDAAEERIQWLMKSPFVVRFLSCEPLLGRVNIKDWLPLPLAPGKVWAECLCAEIDPKDTPCVVCAAKSGIDWVIVGGESGHHARPCAIEWITSVMQQCRDARVACFVKQMGAVVVSEERTGPVHAVTAHPETLHPTDYAPNGDVWAWRAGLTDKKGADPEQFHELRTREFPEVRRG